jgi:enoyl-CoA hydratase/carnithine racemase
MTEHIKIEHKDHILTLTLARPDKKNALTNAMYGALADAILAAERDPKTRVIVLRGEGDMYTAGNDLGEFATMATGNFRGERHVSRFLDAIARATKPIVAAVQGRAVGVGTTMLLHCDFVVLAENAQLTTPFVGLALVPEAASSLLLPLRIGYARAYEMPLDKVHAEAAAVAAKLAKQPAGSLAATKRLMRNAETLVAQMGAESKIFAERLTTPEAREAFTAFAEKRPPDFMKLAS